MNWSIGFQPAFGGGHASRKKPRTGPDAEYNMYHQLQETREHPERGVHGRKVSVLVLKKEVPEIHPSKYSRSPKARM